ncbi:hypothetical protein STENM327S_04078 [Streptomyces tendae]
MCRSPWPRTSASAAGRVTTTASAPPAISSSRTSILLQLMALTAMEEPAAFDAPAAAADQKLEGAAGLVRLPEDLGEHTVRGQYGGGWQGGAQVPWLPGGGGHRPGPPPTPTRRSSSASTTAAGRRALLPAHRQGASAAGPPRSRWLPAGPALSLRFYRHGGAGRVRDRHPRPARRGHDGAVRLQGAGHVDGDPGRVHGLRLRRVLHGVEPGGVRTADLDHPSGTSGTCSLCHQEVEESWRILDPIEEYWASYYKPRQRRRAAGDRGKPTRCSHETDGAAQAMRIDLTDTTANKVNRAPAQVAGHRHTGRGHGRRHAGHRHGRGERLRRDQGGRGGPAPASSRTWSSISATRTCA